MQNPRSQSQYRPIQLNNIDNMTSKEELELILKLIGKYNLPLSPILEYAVKEKIEEYSEEDPVPSFANEEKAEDSAVVNDRVISNDIPVDNLPDGLKIINFGERTIAVIGNTKPHKDAFKSLGGHFIYRTQWGPAWEFRDKKREIIQAYLAGDTSVITREEDGKEDDLRKGRASRYIIRVKYPDGRVFDSNLVWETLMDVIKYAGPERVEQLNIICMGDNLVSSRLNENPLYRSAQKGIGRGLYVCTYSSTDVKFKQIVRINLECKLGLEVEKVYTGDNDVQHANRIVDTRNESPSVKTIEDKRIGYKIKMFPSQTKGEIVKVYKNAKGTKKLVVKTAKGELVEIVDLPYFYEVLKRN